MNTFVTLLFLKFLHLRSVFAAVPSIGSCPNIRGKICKVGLLMHPPSLPLIYKHIKPLQLHRQIVQKLAITVVCKLERIKL